MIPPVYPLTLDQQHDVAIVSKAPGDLLTVGASGLWENQAASPTVGHFLRSGGAGSPLVWGGIESADVTGAHLDDGLASAPSLTYSLDLDTGLFRPASNTVGVAAGGAEVARFGATEIILSQPFRVEKASLTGIVAQALQAGQTPAWTVVAGDNSFLTLRRRDNPGHAVTLMGGSDTRGLWSTGDLTFTVSATHAAPPTAPTGGTTALTLSSTRATIPLATTTSAISGLLNLGAGGFSGAVGHFSSGHTSGVVLAANVAGGFAGDFFNFQVAGTCYARLLAAGSGGQLRMGDPTGWQTRFIGGSSGGKIENYSNGVGRPGLTFGTTDSVLPLDGASTSDNAMDLGRTANRFRSGYYGTSVLTPIVDSGSATSLLLRANGTTYWRVQTNGHFTPGTANLDIAESSNRVRTVFATTGDFSGTGTLNTFLKGGTWDAMGWSGSDLLLGGLQVSQWSRVRLYTGGTERWQFNTSGHFLAASDNTYDIGASGATRPRTGYFGTSVVNGAGAVGSPSYTFTGDTDTGLYWVSANSFGAAVGGSLLARFESQQVSFNGGLFITGQANNQQLVVKGFSTQSQALTEWRKSDNTVVAQITGTGEAHFLAAPPASGGRGLLNLGDGGFTLGVGHFSGNANGQVLAVNAAPSFTGDIENLQVGGATRWKVDYRGIATLTGSSSALLTLKATGSNASGIVWDRSGTTTWSATVDVIAADDWVLKVGSTEAFRVTTGSAPTLRPGAAGTQTLGNSSFRWDTLYTEAIDADWVFSGTSANGTSLKLWANSTTGSSASGDFNTFRSEIKTSSNAYSGQWARSIYSVVALQHSSGTFANVGSVVSYWSNNNAGLVTNGYHFYATTPLSPTGAVTDMYGLYIQSQKIANVTRGWGIWQDGANDRNYFAGQIGIGQSSPNAAALLQLDSTTRGFLPPRVTTAQRDLISSPPEGLVVYNTTTRKLNVYTSAWEQVTSA